jgi:hypothetical protein
LPQGRTSDGPALFSKLLANLLPTCGLQKHPKTFLGWAKIGTELIKLSIWIPRAEHDRNGLWQEDQIVRRMERRTISGNEKDREDFLDQLKTVSVEITIKRRKKGRIFDLLDYVPLTRLSLFAGSAGHMKKERDQ